MYRAHTRGVYCINNPEFKLFFFCVFHCYVGAVPLYELPPRDALWNAARLFRSSPPVKICVTRSQTPRQRGIPPAAPFTSEDITMRSVSHPSRGRPFVSDPRQYFSISLPLSHFLHYHHHHADPASATVISSSLNVSSASRGLAALPDPI